MTIVQIFIQSIIQSSFAALGYNHDIYIFIYIDICIYFRKEYEFSDR